LTAKDPIRSGITLIIGFSTSSDVTGLTARNLPAKTLFSTLQEARIT
jgi:hypothetical protein